MKTETHDILKNTSTATLATLLYKRGLRNQFIQGVSRLGSNTARMGGACLYPSLYTRQRRFKPY